MKDENPTAPSPPRWRIALAKDLGVGDIIGAEGREGRVVGIDHFGQHSYVLCRLDDGRLIELILTRQRRVWREEARRC